MTKTPGIKPRSYFYRKIQKVGDELLDKTILMVNHKNPNVALGALKLLIERLLPALKSIEVKGDAKSPLRVFITKDGFKLSGQTEGSMDIPA